jgi:hypothetical protein
MPALILTDSESRNSNQRKQKEIQVKGTQQGTRNKGASIILEEEYKIIVSLPDGDPNYDCMLENEKFTLLSFLSAKLSDD